MEELAVIHAGGALCRVMQVDGTSVGFGNPQGLYLLPGKHKVLLVYSQPGSAYTFGRRWTKELEVGFVAGHTYLPRFQFADDGGMRLGIEDRGTRYPAACLTFDVYKKQYEQLVVEKVEGCP